MKTKVCKQCGDTKPLDQFYKHKETVDGRRGKCKECWKANESTPQKRQYLREYHQKNRQVANARRSKHYRQNISAKKAYDAKRYADNAEKYRQYQRDRRAQGLNREYNRQRDYRRRAQTPKGTGITKEQWQALIEYHNYRCAYCGCLASELTQDHFIPLSKGGTNTADNILPACRSCNSSKNNSEPYEWLYRKGYTLSKYQK